MPERRSYEVELSWREFGTYEVEAADEDAAIESAIAMAQREGADADEFEVEAVGEVEP